MASSYNYRDFILWNVNNECSKAVCIKKGNIVIRSNYHFTLGKVYDYQINGNYIIKNDEGAVVYFTEWNFKKNFKDVSEIRNEKLTELGI